MKNNIIILALIATAFALGWCANGYRIYAGIVGGMTAAVEIGGVKK